jgi:hypothetical protein
MPLMIIDQEGAEEESQGGSHRAKRSDFDSKTRLRHPALYDPSN